MDDRRLAAFRLLGIPDGSDHDAVVHAYRRLARTTHPDASADPATADRFADLTAAYRLVSEPPAPDPDPAPAVGPTHDPRTAGGPRSVSPDAPSWWPQRPPIVAGPVRVTPSRSPAGEAGP